jgi:hypothetical protein
MSLCGNAMSRHLDVPGLLCPCLFFLIISICAFFAGAGKAKSSVEDGLCLCGHR